MIVLDTNVVSEAMKPEPNATVRAWLNEQVAETLYLTSFTLAEISFGIGTLPPGKRKIALTQASSGLLELFHDRVLPFDVDAAHRYAELAVNARQAGRGFPTTDGYIAAIAASRGFIVASRDTGPYEAARLPVIDPWQVSTTLKDQICARLGAVAKEHPLGHQGAYLNRYIFVSDDGSEVELAFQKDTKSPPNFWCLRQAVGVDLVRRLQPKLYLRSELWNKKAKYGRHSGLKSMPQLGSSDLVCFNIHSLEDLDQIIAVLRGVTASDL